jgi:hypothetical protein
LFVAFGVLLSPQLQQQRCHLGEPKQAKKAAAKKKTVKKPTSAKGKAAKKASKRIAA